MIEDEDHHEDGDHDSEYEPDDPYDGDAPGDDDDGEGRPPPGGISKEPEDGKREIPPKRDILDEHPDHYHYGSAGDCLIYHDDDGNWVKIDKRGRLYRVDEKHGRRIVKTTRPKEFTPEEWKSIGYEHRKALAEEYKTARPDEPTTEGAEPSSSSKKKKTRKKKSKDDDEEESKGKDDAKGHPDDIAVSEVVTEDSLDVDPVPSDCSTSYDDGSVITIDENNNWNMMR